ncbi:hypothetical protein COCSADRAFT_99840, partial [Bipolaris sorokiniana ND90Pr]
DIYNFNETRFAIGVARTLKVVISFERVGWAVVVQLGNRDRKVESLIYYYINYITKLKFLLAFKVAFN